MFRKIGGSLGNRGDCRDGGDNVDAGLPIATVGLRKTRIVGTARLSWNAGITRNAGLTGGSVHRGVVINVSVVRDDVISTFVDEDATIMAAGMGNNVFVGTKM